MRVMFCVHPTPTHLLPTVPLAWALRAAGHEPIHVVLPNVVPTALAAGLHAVGVGQPFDEAAFLRARLPEGTSAGLAWGRPDRFFWSAVALTQVQRAREVAADYLAAGRELGADAVISDPMELAGRLVAAQLGVPLIRHRFGLDPLDGEFEAVATRKLAAMCRQAGVLPAGSEPGLILDPCPPVLQRPAAEPGTHYRYVPYNGPGTTPEWLRRPNGNARRICVTMGTLSKNYGIEDLLNTVVSVAAELPGVEVLVAATGLSEELAARPEVRVITGTPLHQFLSTCDLVVHHGGAGSTLTSAVAGVPQLVLPQQGDQHYNADQVVAAGAGMALEGPQQVERDTLAAAMLAALEPAHRTAAGHVAAAISQLPPPSAMVAAIERLVSGEPRRADVTG